MVGNVVVKKVELYGANNDGSPRSYTVSNTNQISRGILLKLSDPRTAAKADALSASGAVIFGGISAMEKEANDGSTTISAWTNGIFDIKSSGAITIGGLVVAVQDNMVQALRPDSKLASYALIVGTALETATGAVDGEVIEVRVNI